jgi:uncharacterized protein (DUF1501 family)
MAPRPMPATLTRRAALLGLGAAVTLGNASLALADAPTDRRLVVLILRGAMDGLAAVPPYGEPALAALRGELLPPPPGQPGGLLDLGGFFGLHPALAGLHGLYGRGELLIVHAAAGNWRSRSHFEAQDYLELGGGKTLSGTGWLNRVAGAMAATSAGGLRALAIGPELPLLLRGPAPVGTWQPNALGKPPLDFYATLARLHRADRLTGPAIASGLRERGVTAQILAGQIPAGAEPPRDHGAFATLASGGARLLAAPDGPRLAAFELGGWDTHEAQKGRLDAVLAQLDAGLLALRAGLGEAWTRTAVLVITEFGRTVRVNGTKGTDHGTGSVAFVLGGRVAGGRVARDWPGLAPGRLVDGRDLAATTNIHALAAALLRDHLGLNDRAIAAVFPDHPPGERVAGVMRV